MKNGLACLTVVLLAGCSSGNSPNSRRATPAQQEAGRLEAPSQPLSAFSSFELKPLALSEEISKPSGRANPVGQLETRLQARLSSLLDQWKAGAGNSQTGGKLVIQPKLQYLHIISSGERMSAGRQAGNSFIDMDLELTDAKTGAVIANPRIHQAAGGRSSGFRVGAADRNLINSIVEIAYQYLTDNYKK